MKWEIIKELMVYFANIEPYLTSNLDVGLAKRPAAVRATGDIGEPFVKATYCLEGDG